MKQHNELKAAMSRRAWGLLGGAAVIVILGLVVMAMELPAHFLLGLLLVAVGMALAAWVFLGQRAALIAKQDGLIYRSRFRKQEISWKRLSSLQFKNRGGRYYATDMIVVNDMGRKEMEVPLEGFDRLALHAWVESIPARASGKENLLD